MKSLFTFLAVAITLSSVAQGSSCDDAVQIPTDTVINLDLTGSQQHYFYIMSSQNDSVRITVESDTDPCGVTVELLDFNTAQTGTCVPLGTANQMNSNSNASCPADSTENLAIVANQFYYFRIYRNFAPAPENYTLTIESLENNPPTGLAENIEDALLVYPNPSGGKFTLTGVKGHWEVVDLMGNRCFTGSGKVVDLTGYPPAVYLLITKKSTVVKLIKS